LRSGATGARSGDEACEPAARRDDGVAKRASSRDSDFIGAFVRGSQKLGHGEGGVIAYLEPARFLDGERAGRPMQAGTPSTSGAAAAARDINKIKVSRRFPHRDLLRTVDVLAAHGAPLSLPNKYLRTPCDTIMTHQISAQRNISAHHRGAGSSLSLSLASAAAEIGAGSEALMAGVERGAILRDPPWSVLLREGPIEWGVVAERLAAAVQGAQKQ
jgi:hypothetical protein